MVTEAHPPTGDVRRQGQTAPFGRTQGLPGTCRYGSSRRPSAAIHTIRDDLRLEGGMDVSLLPQPEDGH